MKLSLREMKILIKLIWQGTNWINNTNDPEIQAFISTKVEELYKLIVRAEYSGDVAEFELLDTSRDEKPGQQVLTQYERYETRDPYVINLPPPAKDATPYGTGRMLTAIPGRIGIMDESFGPETIMSQELRLELGEDYRTEWISVRKHDDIDEGYYVQLRFPVWKVVRNRF